MLKPMTVRTTIAAILAGLSMSAHAIADPARRIYVPAGELVAALESLAKQADIELVYQAEQLRGIHTGGVSGTYEPKEAVSLLLKGTPLTIRTDAATGVMLIAPPKPAPSISPSSPASTGTGSAANAPEMPQSFWSRIRLAQSDTPSSQAKGRGEVTAGENDMEGQQPARRVAVEEIIVTGSHIKGEEVKSTPKREYDREMIERTGAQTTEQFLRTLPLNFNGGRNVLGDRAANPFDNFANNSRMTTANIHGLAVGSTLTLVNGRRMAPLSVGGNFDISVIPMAAVDRIEIITDGASAIYGSDAIAGVVNFVLRKDFDGAETSVQYGKANDTDYDETTASQVFGRSWASGGAIVSYEYYDRGELRSDERDYSQPPLVPDATLVDPDRRDSFSGSIHQNLGERAVLSLDALYTERGGKTKQSNFQNLIQDYDVTYQTASPSLELQLGGNWSMNVAAVFGGADEDIAAHFMGQTFAFGTHNTFTSADVAFNGGLFALPAGAVNVAIGGQYREEEEESLSSSGNERKKRDTSAAFLELLVPLASPAAPVAGIEEAQLSLAVRYEDYSDVGSSTDPRLGLSFSPVKGLNLRATYGTSFKAPTFSFSEANEFLNIFDGTDPLSQQNALVMFYGGSASGIQPEEAESWTGGFDWTPPALDGFALNVTYYDIVFDGRIAGPAIFYQDFLVDPALYGPFINFSPTDTQVNDLLSRVPNIFNSHGSFTAADLFALIDGRVLNLAKTKSSGVDLQVGYRFPALGGSLNLSLDTAHVIEFDNQPLGTGPTSHDVDRLYRPLAWKSRVGATWTRNRLAIATFLNYSNSYTDTISEPDRSVDSWTTLDLNVRYTFRDEGVLGGLSAFVNARNLFNEDPPFVAAAFNGNFYDGANADPFGRLLSAGFSYRW